MSFHVIIPARLLSTRLSKKCLKKIGKQPMLLHVCQRAIESGAQSVTVATDSLQVRKIVESAGYSAVLTQKDHPSGSDRVFEAANQLNLGDRDIIVNLQGDEPFMPSEAIQTVADIVLTHPNSMGTLCCPIISKQELSNPNTVKVVFNRSKKALYFSRAHIPFIREDTLIQEKTLNSQSVLKTHHYRHIGIYAYTKAFLNHYVHWPVSTLESLEKLEQLRVLDYGKNIYIEILSTPPEAGVDTLADLQRANHYFNNKMGSSFTSK
jgi:3-deoxy-manno-octulosonate cytidylyltransferase (CMP-KDO synthetase)